MMFGLKREIVNNKNCHILAAVENTPSTKFSRLFLEFTGLAAFAPGIVGFVTCSNGLCNEAMRAPAPTSERKETSNTLNGSTSAINIHQTYKMITSNAFQLGKTL